MHTRNFYHKIIFEPLTEDLSFDKFEVEGIITSLLDYNLYNLSTLLERNTHCFNDNIMEFCNQLAKILNDKLCEFNLKVKNLRDHINVNKILLSPVFNRQNITDNIQFEIKMWFLIDVIDPISYNPKQEFLTLLNKIYK